MIELHNTRATRLAFKIASWADGNLGHVMLDPDGSMWATDGFVMIRSVQAHDAEVTKPIFVSPKKTTFSVNPEGFSLSTEEGVLIEHRARSEASFDVEIKRGIRFPNVRNAIPNHLNISRKGDKTDMPHFDSILAGKVAHEYGLKRGIWVAGSGVNRVYLKDLDDGDLIILAGIVIKDD